MNKNRVKDEKLTLRIPVLKLTLILFSLFLTLSCTFSHLKYEASIDDEVTQLIRSVPEAESYPDAGIIYILDEDIVEVSEDGRYKEIIHVVYKILRDRGKDKGDIGIGYNSRTETASIVYAKTVTPEGNIIPINENAVKVVTPYSSYPSYSDYKELTFSMAGVTVGSIIDYKIVKEKQKPEIEGKFSTGVYFQAYDPTYLCRYKIITPKNMDLRYRLLNPLPDAQLSPNIVQQGNKKIYLWEYKNIPQIFREKSMPPTQEVAFRILVTTMNSWEEFSSWWRKQIEGKTEPDEGIKRKVAELTEGLSSSQEKIEAIFDYVKSEIRYVSIDLGKSGYQPDNARKVFENKYGDCKDKSTLLISMLRLAGISAYYALIPTNSMGNLIKDFPYPFQFNHCIVSTENTDTYNFVDPVAKTHRFDYLPSADQNRDVLIFNEKLNLFVKTPLAVAEENAYYNQSQIRIGLDGSIQCESKNYGFGGQEAALRAFFVKSRPTQVKESFEERVDEIFSGAKLLSYNHSNPMDFKERFEVTFKYDAQDYCKKAGDILIFDVPEIWKSCPATSKGDRKYPVVVWDNSYTKDDVEFNIPDGYEVYYLPEPIEIRNEYFEFRSSYRQEYHKIFYQEELIRKALKIASEEYDSYQRYCQGMEKSFNRSILFKKKKGG